MPFNLVGLTNGEVTIALAQMAQDITLQALDMTTQTEQRGVPIENPHSSTMARRLRDFTRMNPPAYIGSKTAEYPQKFVDEIHKILCAMGFTDMEKAKLASCQLKDVAQS